MAEQTRTQRQAAGKRAAATRRQTESRRRTAAARRSARSGQRAAGAVSRDAQGAATQATRAVARGLEAGALRMDAFGRQLERALLIEVGAVLEARDAVTGTVRTFSNRRRMTNASAQVGAPWGDRCAPLASSSTARGQSRSP
jgi:hypothetical protein